MNAILNAANTLVILLFVLIGAGAIWLMTGGAVPFADRNIATVTNVQPTGGVILADFTSLQMGMSFDEVVKIVGKPHAELSRVRLGGTEAVVYMWRGTTRVGNMNATFEDGRLVAKAQFGLR